MCAMGKHGPPLSNAIYILIIDDEWEEVKKLSNQVCKLNIVKFVMDYISSLIWATIYLSILVTITCESQKLLAAPTNCQEQESAMQ